MRREQRSPSELRITARAPSTNSLLKFSKRTPVLAGTQSVIPRTRDFAPRRGRLRSTGLLKSVPSSRLSADLPGRALKNHQWDDAALGQPVPLMRIKKFAFLGTIYGITLRGAISVDHAVCLPARAR